MGNKERYSLQLYQVLGKLFYAVAAADKNVRQEEYARLRKLIKTEWLSVDEFEDDFHTDAAYQIEVVFDWLNSEKKIDANILFNDFINFKEEHPQLFSNSIKDKIIKTAHAIAASFAGKNKAELIMLAKLQINFKK